MDCLKPADQCHNLNCAQHTPLTGEGFAETDPNTTSTSRWLFAPGSGHQPQTTTAEEPAPQYPSIGRNPNEYYQQPELTRHGFRIPPPDTATVTWLGKPKKDHRRRTNPVRLLAMLGVLGIALLMFEAKFGNPLEGPPTVPSTMAAQAFTASIATATPIVRCPTGEYVSAGTGFAIEPTPGQTIILTAAHVVTNCNSDTITLVINGATATGTLIATDTDRDVAAITTDYPIPTLKIAEPPGTRAPVVIVGHPNSSESPIVTYGRITEVTPNELLIRATVQPGNSGSPVIDENRRAVAVVTADLEHAITPTGAATRIDALCGTLIACR